MSEQDNRPYIRRMINEINSNDGKVQVIGTITEKVTDTEYKIDDGTGEISVIFNDSESILDHLGEKMTIKVLGNLLGDSTDVLRVKFASDYSDLDFEMYKKAYELGKKYLD